MKSTAPATVFTSACPSPVGRLHLAATAEGLCGLYLEGQKHMPETSAWVVDEARFAAAREQLAAWFAGRSRQFSLPLHLITGTPFQRQVWQALLEIPLGETWTYSRLAAHVGRPAAVRAVGAAVGRNPLSIIIPCHRVLGMDGGLTGYAGGVERKRWLLAHEGHVLA